MPHSPHIPPTPQLQVQDPFDLLSYCTHHLHVHAHLWQEEAPVGCTLRFLTLLRYLDLQCFLLDLLCSLVHAAGSLPSVVNQHGETRD